MIPAMAAVTDRSWYWSIVFQRPQSVTWVWLQDLFYSERCGERRFGLKKIPSCGENCRTCAEARPREARCNLGHHVLASTTSIFPFCISVAGIYSQHHTNLVISLASMHLFSHITFMRPPCHEPFSTSVDFISLPRYATPEEHRQY